MIKFNCTASNSISRITEKLLFIAILMASPLWAQNVDVYFITGQSNATNLGESSGADGISGDEEVPATGLPFTNVGFNLDVARVGDRSSRDPDVLGSDAGLYSEDPNDRTTNASQAFPRSNIDINFSSSNLNNGTAITTLATNLHRGNDLGIYTFARGGRPLTDVSNTETWYPGSSPIADPANQFDSALYGTFRDWGQDRLDQLTSDGFNPTVKGIFWFQGESDTDSDAAANAYEEDFLNLVTRFREDFGADVPIVASEILVTGTGTSATNLRQIQVNTAMANVAAADPLVSLVASNDLIHQGNAVNNVHLDKGRGSIPNQYVIVAERWAAEVNNLINVDALPCDYVNIGDGCDIFDLDALYDGANGAPPFNTAAIAQWLSEASAGDNPAKLDPADQYLMGDVDLNGDVDSTDLGLLLNSFADASGLGWGNGNLTTDARVDSSDLGLLLNNFGHRSLSTVSTVPEPSGLALFLMCFVYSFRLARSKPI